MSLFGIPIFPEQASTFAKDVDALYFFIIAVSSFFALVVAVVVIYLGIRYRRRHAGEVGARIEGNLPLELVWSTTSALRFFAGVRSFGLSSALVPRPFMEYLSVTSVMSASDFAVTLNVRVRG